MKAIKPYFFAKASKKAQAALRSLSSKYKCFSLNDSNVIVVLGGDGSILSLINHKIFLKKKIYGMNRGTVGFLLNNYSEENLFKRIKERNN